MSHTEARSSFGILLQLGDGDDPEEFTSIAEVRDISPPPLSVDTEEATHHASEGSWEEHVATILRSGSPSFEVNWLPSDATHDHEDGLLAIMLSKARRNFRLVFPDAAQTAWQFAALVTGLTPTGAVAGVMRANITLKPTGPMVFTTLAEEEPPEPPE